MHAEVDSRFCFFFFLCEIATQTRKQKALKETFVVAVVEILIHLHAERWILVKVSLHKGARTKHKNRLLWDGIDTAS